MIELIGATEAAQLAKVSRYTMHRWMKSAGVKPVMHAPGANRPGLYLRTDVEALIDQKRSPAPEGRRR